LIDLKGDVVHRQNRAEKFGEILNLNHHTHPVLASVRAEMWNTLGRQVRKNHNQRP
jgi:hypothetical protein